MFEPTSTLAPLVLQPRLHRRVWGGTWLRAFHGSALPLHGPPGEPVGESWLAGDDSVVLNGPHAGSTVAQVARGMGAALVGSVPFARYGARMPLLAKLLDAAQDLSVQVHPDDAYALTAEAASGHLGKAEAWYVVGAEPGASVLWGFERELDAGRLRAAVAAGDLPRLMNRVPVAPGTIVINPAGTVHAVGAGVRLFEIQQASDLTYRIFDYGRLGADGRPRELHLEKALAVADLTAQPWRAPEARALAGGWQRLVERPEFVVDRRELNAASALPGSVEPTSLELLTVLAGELTLAAVPGAPAWETESLGAGDTVLLPATLGGYLLRGAGEVVRCAVVKEARP